MAKKLEYLLSRRDFMKLAALATASAAIPTFLLKTPSLHESLVKAQAPVSNGLRGQNFNMGWKFNRGDVTNGQSISFDDSGWRSLNVPHDWSIELPFNQSSASGASGVTRELRNRMFQGGTESAGFAGLKWMYEGIAPDRLFA